MVKLIVHRGKHENTYFDATNINEAYLALFKYLDSVYKYYPQWRLDEHTGYNLESYYKAKQGYWKAAKHWLDINEYEGFEIVYTVDQGDIDSWG